MLCLSRKPGERILIGDNVVVTVLRVGPNTVRIGIEAPKSMNIVREEIVATRPQSSTHEEYEIEDKGSAAK